MKKLISFLYGKAAALAVKLGGNKNAVMTALCIALMASSLFAQSQSGFTAADTYMNTIIGFITSPWVKGIAFVALVAECIAMLTAGRQEPGMFKKFIPWIVGTILFMSASTIVKYFMNTLQISNLNSLSGN
ncbi:MAG: TrbC/VirB2 family protein [Treponema sp.]|jgi:type IV secretory pathway VirB2 component (pilin)|nr:TrbC/VirB2 family protein [Treponema sp.]